MQKLIFLDIDGVLNCRAEPQKGVRYPINKRCMNQLNDLTAKTNAEIVVTSTWRKLLSLKDIELVLRERGFKGAILDQTPNLNGHPHVVCRGQEISEWLRSNPVKTKRRYLILDDDSDMLLEQKENFVCVDWWSGLTPKNVYHGVNLLNKGERYAE